MESASPMRFHMIGHGHLDPVWLWKWPEGFEEVLSSKFYISREPLADSSTLIKQTGFSFGENVDEILLDFQG